MKIRKIEKRILPSGLIRWRAPYVDSGGELRSRNFDTKAEATAFLVTVGGELRQGIHTGVADGGGSGRVFGSRIASGGGSSR
jgi:hypothetical protein